MQARIGTTVADAQYGEWIGTVDKRIL